MSTVTGEQNYIKANALYFAVGLVGGGGPFTVLPLNKPGRVEPETPIVTGHSAPVLDFDFNPFRDDILASGSEDMTIKIWGIPEGGLTSNLDTPLVNLSGHQRKVTLLRFHPTADNVLASTSADQTVKLWDIERGMEINANGDHKDLIQDIIWDYIGQNYITSCKDKTVRFVDARSATVAQKIENAHEGAKSIKLAYMGNFDKLVTVGFTRQSQRQFKIWDARNTSTELKKIDIDQAAGVIMPFYDNDTSLLYLAGKGDGNVRFYELVNENPFCYFIAEQRSSISAKGMAWIPKRGLNIMGCETARLLKLTNSSVEPLSFFVPRKSEHFQEDLYPDTAAAIPAHSASEWLSGSNKKPVLQSLNPSIKQSNSAPQMAFKPHTGGISASVSAPVSAPAPSTASVATSSTSGKSAGTLQMELNAAHARISELEARLRAAGLNAD